MILYTQSRTKNNGEQERLNPKALATSGIVAALILSVVGYTYLMQPCARAQVVVVQSYPNIKLNGALTIDKPTLTAGDTATVVVPTKNIPVNGTSYAGYASAVIDVPSNLVGSIHVSGQVDIEYWQANEVKNLTIYIENTGMLSLDTTGTFTLRFVSGSTETDRTTFTMTFKAGALSAENRFFWESTGGKTVVIPFENEDKAHYVVTNYGGVEATFSIQLDIGSAPVQVFPANVLAWPIKPGESYDFIFTIRNVNTGQSSAEVTLTATFVVSSTPQGSDSSLRAVLPQLGSQAPSQGYSSGQQPTPFWQTIGGLLVIVLAFVMGGLVATTVIYTFRKRTRSRTGSTANYIP